MNATDQWQPPNDLPEPGGPMEAPEIPPDQAPSAPNEVPGPPPQELPPPPDTETPRV